MRLGVLIPTSSTKVPLNERFRPHVQVVSSTNNNRPHSNHPPPPPPRLTTTSAMYKPLLFSEGYFSTAFGLTIGAKKAESSLSRVRLLVQPRPCKTDSRATKRLAVVLVQTTLRPQPTGDGTRR